MAVVRGLLGVSIGGLLSAVPVIAQAQTGTLTGRVIDSTSQAPITGVAVRIEGTPLGTLTRDDGTFTIAGVPTGARTLRISRIGFAAQARPLTVAAGPNPALTIVMRQLVAQLSEIVAVGYGTQRREAVTAAVSTVNADQARVGVQPNVNTLIQGRAAGVQITQNSGDPGAGAQIRVRGGSSISANDEPLYVIDGVPILNEPVTTPSLSPGGAPLTDRGTGGAVARSPLNLLNPTDIAEITILKDASATAIYGSRGANGVVLITTKKGVAGTSTVDYDGFYAAARAAKTLDVLSGNEYRSFYQQQIAAGTKGFTAEGLQALGTANTNWQDAILRTARLQNHNVSFSGGSQSTQYRASVNYFDQPGIVIGSGLTRYQGRLNGTSRLLGDRLTVNLNLTSSQTRDRFLLAENTGGFEGGVFINALTYNPTRPIFATTTGGATPYYELGAGAQGVRNPVGLANQINDRATAIRTLGNLQMSYALIPSLTASANVGVDRTASNRGTYLPTNSPLGAQYGGGALLGDRNLQGATVQALLTFDRSFADVHSLNVVGGYEYQRYGTSEFTTAAQGFVTDANGVNNIGAGSTVLKPFSYRDNRNLVSQFARANYGFRDRYFITGVVRRDGSSVFGANNKYAVFPGVSASWRITQESFARSLPFQELRLRAGYGLQGNQAIRPYQTLALLGTDPNSRYPFGTTLITGVLPTQNPNPNLRWETTAQANVGLDFGVLSNRLTGTLEYYSKVTRDLLLEVPIPAPSVVSTQLQNIGRLKNAGFEGTIDGQVVNQPGRTVSLGLVFTADRNRILSLGGRQRIFTGTGSGRGQSATQSQIAAPGLPLGTFYGPVYAGVKGGIEQFNKYDANGKITGTTTSPDVGTDYQILGNANPKFTLGFRGNGTYSRFDASFLLRAVQGNKIFNNTALVYATKANASQSQNFLRSALSDSVAITEANKYSSRFIEDGSFVRLQNVTVGYRIPLNTVVRRVTSARVYLSGDNLLLGTRYSGYDPEVNVVANANGIPSRGIDYLTYPRARTFTFGTQLGF